MNSDLQAKLPFICWSPLEHSIVSPLNSDFQFIEITQICNIYRPYKPDLVLSIRFPDRILKFRSLCRAGTRIVKKFSVSLHPTWCGVESYLFYSRITSAEQNRRCFENLETEIDYIHICR